MMYEVFSKYWSENDVGEITEGPWISRGVFPTEEQAEAFCAKFAQWGEGRGCHTKIEKKTKAKGEQP